jgi:hypothetical protein
LVSQPPRKAPIRERWLRGLTASRDDLPAAGLSHSTACPGNDPSVVPLWFVDCLGSLKLPAGQVDRPRPHNGDGPAKSVDSDSLVSDPAVSQGSDQAALRSLPVACRAKSPRGAVRDFRRIDAEQPDPSASTPERVAIDDISTGTVNHGATLIARRTRASVCNGWKADISEFVQFAVAKWFAHDDIS